MSEKFESNLVTPITSKVSHESKVVRSQFYQRGIIFYCESHIIANTVLSVDFIFFRDQNDQFEY